MAISINWATKVISVPKADTTLLQASPEIRELDVDVFRLELRALEATFPGMPCPRTHNHNTEVLLGGDTYARIVEIVNGYTVTFEDGQYAVKFVGANHNVDAVANVNQVSLRSTNSAGLIRVTSGSGVTAQDKVDIITGVWADLSGETVRKIAENKVTRSGTVITIFEDDAVTPWRQYDLADGEKLPV